MKGRDTGGLPPLAVISGAQTDPGLQSPDDLRRAVADLLWRADVPVPLRKAIERLIGDHARQETALMAAGETLLALEAAADEDPGLPVLNRRAFMRELDRVLAYVQRYRTTASLVFFDLNGLKAINDGHGHRAGDLALERLAHVLMEHVRRSDLVGRLGGDEFVVLLQRTDEAGARSKAARLAAAFADEPLEFEGAILPLSVSVGVAELDPSTSAQDAVERADAAMYVEKRAHRAARDAGSQSA